MYEDGAHAGVLPWPSYRRLLDGYAPHTHMSLEQMRHWIVTPLPRVEEPSEEQRFNDTAHQAVLTLWHHCQSYPEDLDLPLYSHRAVRYAEVMILQMGLYDLLCELYAGYSSLPLSMFQFGWTVNAVRFVLGLPMVANPGVPRPSLVSIAQ